MHLLLTSTHIKSRRRGIKITGLAYAKFLYLWEISFFENGCKSPLLPLSLSLPLVEQNYNHHANLSADSPPLTYLSSSNLSSVSMGHTKNVLLWQNKMTEAERFRSQLGPNQQKASFVGCLLITSDHPESERYAILSMAMTDERGEEPNQRKEPGNEMSACFEPGGMV